MNAPLRLKLQLQRPNGFQLSLDLSLPGRGVCALFGASGSGKTTVLRCVAGLERPGQALVEVAGQTWQDDRRGLFVPTWRRRLGYVFQEASLFEHLDVRGNLRFGLQRAAREGAHADALDEAVQLLGIGALLARHPHQLSGGERQRVAIARALATRPQVLLLDEPLFALDPGRREEVLPWLEKLRDEAGLPMLYVTHSVEEMTRLADTLVVLEAGQAVATGPVDDVLAAASPGVLPPDDSGVLLHGHVQARDARWQLAQVAFPGGAFWLRDPGLPEGRPVRIRVLARDVSLALARPQATSVQNLLPCTVAHVEPDPRQGASVIVRLACGAPGAQATLLARITARAAHDLVLAPGTPAWAQVKAVALVR